MTFVVRGIAEMDEESLAELQKRLADFSENQVDTESDELNAQRLQKE